jgi:hypothetical protein
MDKTVPTFYIELFCSVVKMYPPAQLVGVAGSEDVVMGSSPGQSIVFITASF